MRGLHSLFVILWLLPTITIQLPTHSSRDSVIDWSGCGTFTKCFCLNEQKKVAQEDNNIPKADESTSATDSTRCNIGVQNKFFSKDELVVFQLQVIGDKYELGNDPQLVLYHGTKLLFGCKWDSKSDNYEVVGDAEIKKNLRISLFEDRTHFKTGSSICALKFERSSRLKKWMDDHDGGNKFSILKLLITHPVEHQFDIKGFYFLASTRVNCDPFSFIDSETRLSLNYHIEKLRNIDRIVLNCEEYDSSLYTMRYANSSHQDISIGALTCIYSDSDGYSYHIVEENGDTKPLVEPDQYSFYCAANIGKVCKSPIHDCKATEICPQINKNTVTADRLECPGQKWIINGEYLKLNVEPVCKRNPMKRDEAAFHTVFGSDYEEKTQNARCFKYYDCYNKSKLRYSDCKEEDACGEIVYNDGIMKCKDSKKRLSIFLPALNETLRASNYTCDASTGQWKDHKGAFLPDGAGVSCPGKPTLPDPVVDMTLKQMVGTIIGVFAGCALVAVLVPMCVYLHYFKPKVFLQKGKKGWLKTKKSEKIAYSKDLFSKVTQCTIDTPYRIIHGFNQLELMLDTETLEPKIWEELYLFLMRFQGAIEKLDHNISLMFMRYMFLQAKKIIDKHGWVSEKPITKKTKDRSALMRPVAIRLLAFSFNYPNEDDAERFAMSGFRKLGCNAVEQYPHCGELWTLMLHDRILGSCMIKKSSSIRLFDRDKFTEIIQEIAFDETINMRDKDVIPEFGSPSEQAAFALGGSPNLKLHEIIVKDAWKVTKSTTREKYVAGMGFSLSRNPVPPIICSFSMVEEANQEFLENLPKIVNETEWNTIIEKTMKIMVFFGRPLDAKRLQARFMPSVTQPSELYSQTKMDQQFFEEAVENQLGELRKWFAKRTDKEEIKNAPVYIKDEELEAGLYAKMEKQRKEIAIKDEEDIADQVKIAAEKAAAVVPTAEVNAAAAAEAAAPPVVPTALPEQKP